MIGAQVASTVEAGLLMLALAILIGPALAERLRIPGLVGLIFVGMIFGPFVLGWMVSDGLVAAVGAAGLLYLMFLAGIELDLATFIENRTAAMTFGLLTFAVPFAISFWVGSQYLDFGLVGAALVGAMWASHTIVAYPEIKSAGLDGNREVGIAVASTVITDILALTILAVSASSAALSSEPGASSSSDDAPLPLWLGLILLGVFTLWALPRMAKWAFTNFGQSRTQRFIVALAAMSAGAVVSLLGGIEGLVGAFLAGIGINRLVPARGALMERIEFFGSSLFVPAFLVSVGLSIDPTALVQLSTIRLALIFAGLVLVGKTLAAVIAGKIFGLTNPEIGVIASLTIGQAAATLAIAQVGVESGLFTQQILNAAVLTVVVTVLITSFGTRYFASRVDAPKTERLPIGAHVMLMAPVEDHGEVAVASAIATPDGGLVSPFIVERTPPDDAERARLDAIVEAVTALGHDSEGIVRIGAGAGEEIRDLIVESRASLLIVPWAGGRASAFTGHAGLDEIGKSSPVPVVAARLGAPKWDRVIVATGSSQASYSSRQDAMLAVEIGKRVSQAKDIPLEVHTTERAAAALAEVEDAAMTIHDEGDYSYADSVTDSDLVILPVDLARGGFGLGPRRPGRLLTSTSLLVVGGPHRLTLTRRVPSRTRLGFASERDVERYMRSFSPGRSAVDEGQE